MKSKILILLTALILSSGCTPTPKTVGDLYIPADTSYPKVKAQELACLDDRTYTSLVERDLLKDSRIETLESIIKLGNDR